jgi:molybdopterin molybdotransferase
MTPAETLSSVVNSLADFDPNALPVALAREAIERFITPIDSIEVVPLRRALDRVLARDVISPIDVPAHDNAAMDGWAVPHADLDSDSPKALDAVGTALAGKPFPGRVSTNQAVRIMTGAVMPAGCDTVVMQELVTTEGMRIMIPPRQQMGQHRRLRGEDLSAGKTALSAGRLLGPTELGLLASLGVADIPVQRRLRVAFFSTGDELRSIGEPLDPGCVYDSNRFTLIGLLTRLGVELIDLGVVPDSPQALESAVRDASRQADAIVSSGGVSVGEADYTRAIMNRLGEVAFWTIAMRPGRPMAFGRIGQASYFGLPGNPVAVMITFLFFVRDALIRQAGATPRPVLPVPVRSTMAIRKKAGRTEYQRAIVQIGPDGVLQARLTGSQGSGVLRSMSEANCLLVLRHDQGDIASGDLVDAVLFDGLI